MTDYHKVFAGRLCDADVPAVISESASLSSCGEEPVIQLNLTQKEFILPQIEATNMTIEPSYRPNPENQRQS